jgi:hypothetical protein
MGMRMVMEWVKFLEGMLVKYKEEMEINLKPGMGMGMELVELLKGMLLGFVIIGQPTLRSRVTICQW